MYSLYSNLTVNIFMAPTIRSKVKENTVQLGKKSRLCEFW